MKSVKLLPFWCKIPGLILIAAGLVLTALYLWTDLQIFVRVPAIVSSFLVTKYFTVTRTNIADEFLMITLVSGFLLIVFSEERNERKIYRVLRLTSLYKAVMVNSFVMIFSVIFIYGQGFLIVLVVNLVSVFLLYLVFFYRNLIRR